MLALRPREGQAPHRVRRAVLLPARGQAGPAHRDAAVPDVLAGGRVRLGGRAGVPPVQRGVQRAREEERQEHRAGLHGSLHAHQGRRGRSAVLQRRQQQAPVLPALRFHAPHGLPVAGAAPTAPQGDDPQPRRGRPHLPRQRGLLHAALVPDAQPGRPQRPLRRHRRGRGGDQPRHIRPAQAGDERSRPAAHRGDHDQRLRARQLLRRPVRLREPLARRQGRGRPLPARHL